MAPFFVDVAPIGATNSHFIGANVANRWRQSLAPIGDFRGGAIFPTRKMWTWRQLSLCGAT